MQTNIYIDHPLRYPMLDNVRHNNTISSWIILNIFVNKRIENTIYAFALIL